MVFSNRNKKSKSYQKEHIGLIVKQKSKLNLPQLPGTIDYKNIILLRKFITTEGKILSRRINGLNAKQQRYITKAIKKARIIGLLPFINHSHSPRL